MSTPTIYASLEAAHHAMPDCPRPLGGSGGYHWWYIDHEKLAEQWEAAEEGKEETSDQDFVPCICKTCSQRMLLSAEAEEYPV